MKKINLYLILLLTFSINTVWANVSIDAPLGLTWGMSVEEIESTGAKLGAPSVSDGMSAFPVLDIPNRLADFPNVTIFFSEDYGLVRVLLVSKVVRNDPFGREVKNLYNNYKEILQDKYGEASLVEEQVGLIVYKELDEFYQCLIYPGCGIYSSLFGDAEKKLANISLSVKGIKRAEGYIDMMYSSDDFGKHAANQKSKQNAKARALL